MEKKLYRIMEGKQLAGVCTGLAEYFKLDVSVVRLIWVLFTLFAGSGLLAYIVCALIIPEKPNNIIDAE
jgi:phage shock protein C